MNPPLNGALAIGREPGADDEERIIQAARKRLRQRREALLDGLELCGKEPWLDLSVSDGAIADVPLGSCVIIAGGTGAGKTAFAQCIGEDLAAKSGPVIVVALELGQEAAAARAIASREGLSWKEVLRGGVSRKAMAAALHDRLIFHDEDCRTIGSLREAIHEARAAYPGEPIAVIIDYAQLWALSDPEIRVALGRILEDWRKLAKEERVVLLILSQTSRGAAKDLRDGERTGAQTLDVGAETAQLERGAALTLALGVMGPPDDRGWHNVEVSIGKNRYGAGDRVQAARFHGPSGRWQIQGEARPASEVRAERRLRAKRARGVKPGKEAGRGGAARLAIKDSKASASGEESERDGWV